MIRRLCFLPTPTCARALTQVGYTRCPSRRTCDPDEEIISLRQLANQKISRGNLWMYAKKSSRSFSRYLWRQILDYRDISFFTVILKKWNINQIIHHTSTDQFIPIYIFTYLNFSLSLHIQSCVKGNLFQSVTMHACHVKPRTNTYIISFEFMNGILSRQCGGVHSFFSLVSHIVHGIYRLSYGQFFLHLLLYFRNPLYSTLFREFAPINSVTSATKPSKRKCAWIPVRTGASL